MHKRYISWLDSEPQLRQCWQWGLSQLIYGRSKLYLLWCFCYHFLRVDSGGVLPIFPWTGSYGSSRSLCSGLFFFFFFASFFLVLWLLACDWAKIPFFSWLTLGPVPRGGDIFKAEFRYFRVRNYERVRGLGYCRMNCMGFCLWSAVGDLAMTNFVW